jgi:hypothetical protein
MSLHSLTSVKNCAGQMPPDQWGMSTAAAKNRNWNASNVILAFFGPQAVYPGMAEAGEVAFKRQLYQSMIGQLLFLKTEIETWRSSNVFGTTFWMYATGGSSLAVLIDCAVVRC